MLGSKHVKSPIVPSSKISKDVEGTTMNETYFKQIVRSLLYLTSTQFNIMFSVSLTSRYMSKPTKMHLQAAKRILMYLKESTSYGIFYKKRGEENLLLSHILLM